MLASPSEQRRVKRPKESAKKLSTKDLVEVLRMKAQAASPRGLTP